MDLVERIKKLQKREADSRQELARLEGRQQQLLTQLEQEFGLKTLEEAEKKLAALDADISKRKARIEKLVCQLEEAVNG